MFVGSRADHRTWLCSRASLSLPSRLSSIGVRAEHIEGIVERSLGIERLNRLNARRPTREALVALLQGAL